MDTEELSHFIAMAAAELPKKMARRTKYSDIEVLSIAQEVERREAIILGKLERNITAAMKTIAWEEVQHEVNAVSRVWRTAEEARRKFRDMRTHIKSEAAAEARHMQGTGESHFACCHSTVGNKTTLGNRRLHFIE